MNCPACETSLNATKVGDVTVDVCMGGCAGIWFDRFELDKLDEAHEAKGMSLLEIPRNPELVVDPKKRYACPKCANLVLMRRVFGPARNIEIDECPGCAGIWLDSGELAAIGNLPSEEERKKAAERQFQEVFGTQLAAMREQSQEDAERSRRFASTFRFICPSYWIPGKQSGGAF